eukprot:gene11907-13141_t
MQRRSVKFKEQTEENGLQSSQVLTVERLTNELRNCYDAVDEGRSLLAQLYEKLRHQKYGGPIGNGIGRRNEKGDEEGYYLLLSREVDDLKNILQKIAAKREDYVHQLTSAQNIIWNDRRQMESFLRSSRKVERRFQEKVNFLDQFSQKPETLVTELRENSKLLSELLANLQEQILAEEQYIRSQVEHDGCTRDQVKKIGFSIGQRDRRSYLHDKRANERSFQSEARSIDSNGDVKRHEKYRSRSYSPVTHERLPESPAKRRLDAMNVTSRSSHSDVSPNKQGGRDAWQETEFDLAYERFKRRRNLIRHTDSAMHGVDLRPTGNDESSDQDLCDTSSLSERLKQLVKQSENVQKLINASSKTQQSTLQDFHGNQEMKPDCQSDGDDVKRQVAGVGDSDGWSKFDRHENNGKTSRVEYEIPAKLMVSPEKRSTKQRIVGNENDLARCDCQSEEIRARVLASLEKVDRMESSKEPSSAPARNNAPAEYDKTNHEQVRKDLMLCLDKIFTMEKSYGVAEEEIKQLKIDLRQAVRERDIMDRVMKTEAEELRERLRVKNQNVDSLTGELLSVRQELEEEKRGRTMQNKSDSLGAEDVEKEIEKLKRESEDLKKKVQLKSDEVDELRKELEKAIEEIGKMKQHTCGENGGSESDEIKKYKQEIISLKAENKKLSVSSAENIAEELAALQTAIANAEEKQGKLFEDNNRLMKENDDLKGLVEKYSNRMPSREAVFKAEKKITVKEVESLQRKIAELELALAVRGKQIEGLKANVVTGNMDRSQINDFTEKEEQYRSELKKNEKEMKEMKERLLNYEEILANEGKEIGRKLDEMYENFVKSIQQVRQEKEDAEEELKNLKGEHEVLLQEYINKLSEIEERKNYIQSYPEFKDSRKQEVFEAMLKSNHTTEQLAKLLSTDIVDATPQTEAEHRAREAENENEELYKKLIQIENDILKRYKEVEKLKKENAELKGELEYAKSEQYIKNKINEDIASEKTDAYEILLEAKDVECNALKEEVKKLKKEAAEGDELSARIDHIYNKFMVAEEKEDGAEAAGKMKNYEKLEEELDRRNKDVKMLKISNRRLKDLLMHESTIGSGIMKKSISVDDLCSDDADDDNEKMIDALGSEYERNLALEEENLALLKRIKDLNEKLYDLTGVEEDNKMQSKRLREKDKRCQSLEDENLTLRERLRSLQNEIKELSSVTRTRKASRNISDDIVKENEQLQERIVLIGLDNEGLHDDINELKSKLHKSEYEAGELEEQLKTVKSSAERMSKLQEEKLEMEEQLKELKKKIAIVEKERKHVNEECVKQKIKNEEVARVFSNEIKELKAEVVSLVSNKKQPPYDGLDASYESLPGDEADGGQKFDRNKLIRKLQTENHQLSARIISLEDETTATTKLVADMERGHGHLTGMLRSHLILQKETTAKLLENSLKQYSEEFEKVERRFKAIEDKYDKEKKHSTRRNFAWDLFANAMATITNINAIMEEGLIKVDDDLERDFSSDEDFEAKDYKSRLWILRRRLDDVENRHRELLLRSEELSIRLDAKTTEYDVTQAELEDTIRILEIKELEMEKMKYAMDDSVEENARLKNLLARLKEHQEQTIGAVIAENEMLKKDFETSLMDRSMQSEKEVDELKKRLAHAESNRKEEVNELREKLLKSGKKREEEVMERKKNLDEQAAKYEEEMKKLKLKLAEAENEIDKSDRKIKEMEDLLKKMEDSNAILEKYLQKARSGCRSEGIDHHGTIHMLRDDLKKLFKENEELKKELDNRQKKITSLAADLRKAKIAVKEQIGTDRTLDEQILDRATKDQIMALKRRIKVLEMEKERLLKGMSIREGHSKGSDDQTNSKRESPRSKSIAKKKSSSSSSGLVKKSDHGSTSEITDSKATGDDTEDDIDVSLTEDVPSGVSEDIELRDKLIQELELRVRELKYELSLRSQQDENSASKTGGVDEVDSASDMQSLRDENGRLKAKLEESRLAKKKVALEAEIMPSSSSSVEAGVGFEALKQPKTPGKKDNVEDDGSRIPQFINIDVEFKEEESSLSSGAAQQGRGQSRIPVSPRGKRPSKTQTSLTSTESKSSEQGRLEIKIKEQEDDIKTLLQSVEYFEKENESLKDKSDTNDDLQERLNKSEKEVKGLTAKVSKLKDQLKDSKTHEDKLKNLEDRMKKLITENRNLEQQIRKSKAQQLEEGKRNAKERDLVRKNTREMQQHVDSLKEDIGNKEKVLQALKTELDIGKYPSDESSCKKILRAAIDKKVKEKLKNSSKSQEVEESLAEAISEKRVMIQEIQELRKELDIAMSDGRESKKLAEKAVAEMSKKEKEMQQMRARNIVLEVTQDVISNLSSNVKDDALLSHLQSLETEMGVVKARNIVLEVMHDVIGNLGIRLQEKKNSEEFKSLEDEMQGLKARNFVLELTQEAVNEMNAKLSKGVECVQDQSFDDPRRYNVLNLQIAWEDLKKKMEDLELIDEDGIEATSDVFDAGKDDLQLVADEIENACAHLQKKSQQKEEDRGRLVILEDELEEQRRVNVALEKKINEFKQVIKETSTKVQEMEIEQRDLEGDEIGHQLVKDQISMLKEKIGEMETEKLFVEELSVRDENNIKRLTDQVRALENKLNEREMQVSEVTQRALESEEDLEFVKRRNEELEDEYQKLLQYSMQLEEGKAKGNDNEEDENEQLLIKMEETINKLEEDKEELQKKIEEASFSSLIQQSPRSPRSPRDTADAFVITSQDFEKQIERGDEFEKMQDSVRRLELENRELKKHISLKDDRSNDASKEGTEQELLKAKEVQILQMEDEIYRLELDKEDLEQRVQDLLKSESSAKETVGVGDSATDADRDDEIAKLEETVYRLELDNVELEQKVNDLLSDDKEDTRKLKETIAENEEKMSQLEMQVNQLSIQNRDLQASMDDILASPRSTSDDEETMKDRSNEIFQGGPQKWKRRLVIAYRELREKSVEVVNLRMILAAKNTEDATEVVDVAAKRVPHQEDGRTNVYLLQEEIKLKAKEIDELHDEVSVLKNSLEMKSRAEDAHVSLMINGVDGNEVENEELRKEVDKLKTALLEKEEMYEKLCKHLFGVGNLEGTEAMDNLQTEISELKKELDQKQVKCDELESSNELLYNELIKAKAVGSDMQGLEDRDASNRQTVAELEHALTEQDDHYKQLAHEYSILEEKYRNELDYASAHIGELMVEIDRLEAELKTAKCQMDGSQENVAVVGGETDKVLKGRLQRTEDELKGKNRVIANLEETIASFFDNTQDIQESHSKELKRLARENKSLQQQLDLQKQRYELELDSLSNMSAVGKGEHVHSLKDDFERVCKDKIQLQVKLSEIEEKCAKQGIQVDELMAKNSQLSNKIKEYNDKYMMSGNDPDVGGERLGDVSL